MNPDCYFGDHAWRGTSQCVRCDARLRCHCGVFVREDNLDAHLERCPVVAAQMQEERDELLGMVGL